MSPLEVLDARIALYKALLDELAVVRAALVGAQPPTAHKAVAAGEPSGDRPANRPALPTCSRCPAFLYGFAGEEGGLCAGCRAPEPTQVVDTPRAPAKPGPAAVREEPAAGKATPATDRRPATGAGQRLTIARLLAAEPLGPSELARRLGISRSATADLLKFHWFAKSGPFLRAPYHLTPAGRAALASSTASGSAAASGGPDGGPETRPPSSTRTASAAG